VTVCAILWSFVYPK